MALDFSPRPPPRWIWRIFSGSGFSMISWIFRFSGSGFSMIFMDFPLSSAEMVPTWAGAAGTAGPRGTRLSDKSDFLRLV